MLVEPGNLLQPEQGEDPCFPVILDSTVALCAINEAV